MASTLRVNGADLLTLSYDPVSSSEALFSVSGEMMINITYDSVGRPVLWDPVPPLVPSNVSYDHWGYITGWTRGNLSEEYHYDALLRLASVSYADGSIVNYDYRDKLTKVRETRAFGFVLVIGNVGLHCSFIPNFTLGFFHIKYNNFFLRNISIANLYIYSIYICKSQSRLSWKRKQ